MSVLDRTAGARDNGRVDARLHVGDGREQRGSARQTIARRVTGLACLLWVLASGCSRPPGNQFQGYIEADFVRVAAPVPGILLERPVRRGDSLTRGSPLFTLEAAAEQAALAEAEGRLAQSRARLENVRKGRRPSEIASLEARLAQARATRELSDLEFARREQLRRQDVLSISELDQARSRRDADHALAAALEAEIQTARLGAREDEIRAAEEDIATAEAAVRRSRWGVDQKTQVAPVDGRVDDTLFEAGEFVPAGTPVVSLLPAGNLKVRFFVPQAELPRAQPGAKVEVQVDGLAAPVPGTVRWVSSRAEFTPPVIFSRETRQKLVFRVEATFDGADNPSLRPGQPVDVRWSDAR